MEELFVPFCVFLILLAPIAFFMWQFHKVRRGLSSRLKAIFLYAAYSAVPVLLYLGIFIALVGIEELLNTSLVGEGYARSLMIGSVGGAALIVVGTIIFSIVVAFVKGEAIKTNAADGKRSGRIGKTQWFSKVYGPQLMRSPLDSLEDARLCRKIERSYLVS